MIILIFWIGVYPDTFLGFTHESVRHLIERVNSGGLQGQTVANNLMGILK
jgi:NADH:ubiquinone oxidoreductase subunit 4 (subunit M)